MHADVTHSVVTVDRDVAATMRDGVVLRADVFRPASDELLPVLVMRLPYGKQEWTEHAEPKPEQIAAAGYLVVVQDVRGRFASDGVFDSPRQELNDGFDTVQWAAALPGSNGVVGTFGPSYLAQVQWAAALQHPPALRSIQPSVSPNHSALDGFFVRGGAIEVGSRLGWAHGAIGPDDLARTEGLDEGQRREAWERTQQRFDSGDIYRDRPFNRLRAEVPIVEEAIEVWGLPLSELAALPTMTRRRYDEIDLPAFLVGGWYDLFLGSTLAQFRAMSDRTDAAGPTHLVVGPWTHMDNGSTVGDVDFGPAAAQHDMGDDLPLADQYVRWFDATLKDQPERLDDLAPVRLFVMGENRWRSFATFPPPADATDFFLTADGRLDTESPAAAGAVSYRYDPDAPVPTAGGATLMLGYDAGPKNQRAVQERDDVVSFVGDVLTEAVTLVGYIEATLFAATTAVDTDFIVRLCDDHPDGTSINIADGIIRASARDSYDHSGFREPVAPSTVTPRETYEYRFNLWATAHSFLPGHRIRVDITSSSFPRWDANLNTGASSWDSSASIPADQTIRTGGRTASRVRLPLVPPAIRPSRA